MARLSPAVYLHHLESESARLRAVLASCDPAASVPSCPEWTAADLLDHHCGVLDFWATIIERRPVGPEELAEPAPPTAYDDLLGFHQEHAARLVTALGSADPAAEAWSWSAERTVGFTIRRQAHEALIHRLDAELTAGTVTALDPALAADGVDEALDVMFGGTPAWGSFASHGRHVRVDITDVGESLWVETGRFTGTDPQSGEVHDLDDISVVGDPRVAADVVVTGPSATLDAWLWGRGGDDEVSVSGDDVVAEHFRACVSQSIG